MDKVGLTLPLLPPSSSAPSVFRGSEIPRGCGKPDGGATAVEVVSLPPGSSPLAQMLPWEQRCLPVLSPRSRFSARPRLPPALIGSGPFQSWGLPLQYSWSLVRLVWEEGREEAEGEAASSHPASVLSGGRGPALWKQNVADASFGARGLGRGRCPILPPGLPPGLLVLAQQQRLAASSASEPPGLFLLLLTVALALSEGLRLPAAGQRPSVRHI